MRRLPLAHADPNVYLPVMPDLPRLSPQQNAILEASLDGCTSVTDLARGLHIPLDHLLAQLSHLRPYIEAALELESLLADRIAERAATGATGILHDIATSLDTHPIERRRAATTIARARPARRQATRPHHPPPSPRAADRPTRTSGATARDPSPDREQCSTASHDANHLPAPASGAAMNPVRSPRREPGTRAEPQRSEAAPRSPTTAPDITTLLSDPPPAPPPSTPPLTPTTLLASAAGRLPPHPIDTS